MTIKKEYRQRIFQHLDGLVTAPSALALFKNNICNYIKEKQTVTLSEISENLSFVRNQIITSEVNISRIYNWDVRKKRQERLEAQENK